MRLQYGDKVRHGYYFTNLLLKRYEVFTLRSPYSRLTTSGRFARPRGAAAASGWPVGASLEPPGLPSARRDGANSDAAVAGYSFVAIAVKYRYGTNSHNVSFKNAVWQTFSSAVLAKC